jgi:hypothetical protein
LPICGVILSLVPNLENRTLLAPGRGQKQDDRKALAPFFGCTLREDKNVDPPQDRYSYEHQIGITRRPELSGLGDVAGLVNLRALSFESQALLPLEWPDISAGNRKFGYRHQP